MALDLLYLFIEHSKIKTRTGPKIPAADPWEGVLFWVFGHWISGSMTSVVTGVTGIIGFLKIF